MSRKLKVYVETTLTTALFFGVLEDAEYISEILRIENCSFNQKVSVCTPRGLIFMNFGLILNV